MNPLPVLWTTDRLIIRDSGLEEVDTLRDIFNANSAIEPWDPTFAPVKSDEIHRLLLQSEAPAKPDGESFQMQTLFAQEGGERVGYFHLYHALAKAPRLSFISMLVIRPDLQRQGYGREAMEGVVDYCRDSGERDALGVRVYLKNWPALRFWTSMGFTEIESIDGDKVHDAHSHASAVLLCRFGD